MYEIFGLPHGVSISREQVLALYSEESRAAVERLRTYSIAHQQSFVIDAEIRPASGDPMRWMRLIGAPVLESGRTVRLHGLKLWL